MTRDSFDVIPILDWFSSVPRMGLLPAIQRSAPLLAILSCHPLGLCKVNFVDEP